MTTSGIQRNKTTWLLFIVVLLLSGFFAFINLHEFVLIRMLKQTSGYPFGGEGPTPWFYKTPNLYAMVNLIFGLLFFLMLAVCSWAVFKNKTTTLMMTLALILFLIFIQIINGQSD